MTPAIWPPWLSRPPSRFDCFWFALSVVAFAAANATTLNANQKQSNLLGGLLNQGGQIAGVIASDERLKTEITDARSEVDQMLDRLLPKAYVYKDSKHGV